MYFLRRQAPIQLTSERAEGMRPSLNSPVLSTPELPPGPARAAILVHRELEGRLAVSVGVKSLKSACSAIWTCDAELDEPTTLELAIDAALSFAEGMGFLFDDDLGAGFRASTRWHELIGDAPEAPEMEEPIELLLEVDDEEVLELADGPGFDLDEATFEQAEPQVPLSKFRRRLPADPGASPSGVRGGRPRPDQPDQASEPAPGKPTAPAPRAKAAQRGYARGRSALGELKLVKRRRDADAGRRTWLVRVLSSF